METILLLLPVLNKSAMSINIRNFYPEFHFLNANALMGRGDCLKIEGGMLSLVHFGISTVTTPAFVFSC